MKKIKDLHETIQPINFRKKVEKLHSQITLCEGKIVTKKKKWYMVYKTTQQR